jgi:hypothetical protein
VNSNVLDILSTSIFRVSDRMKCDHTEVCMEQEKDNWKKREATGDSGPLEVHEEHSIDKIIKKSQGPMRTRRYSIRVIF